MLRERGPQGFELEGGLGTSDTGAITVDADDVAAEIRKRMPIPHGRAGQRVRIVFDVLDEE